MKRRHGRIVPRHADSYFAAALRRCLIGLLLCAWLPVTVGADPRSDRRAAIGIRLFRATLAADLAIRKLPIRVEITDAAGLSRYQAQPPASGRLRECVALSKTHGIVLYSPFGGDVEHGATAGLHISALVHPYVNLGTLEESGIELKEFFLKIAKTYR